MPMSIPTDADLNAQSAALGQRLQQASLQLVTAESCSGGWIAKCMTDIAGSSAFFDCGMVVYSYEAKQRLLGVRAQTLEQFGAVSRETVLEMVSGALVNSGAGIAVAVTGIAGPGGGARTSRSAVSGLAGSAVAAMPAPSCSSSTATAKPSAGKPWRRHCAVSTPSCDMLLR